MNISGAPVAFAVMLFCACEVASSEQQPRLFEFVKSPKDKAVINTGGEGLPTTSFDPFLLIDEEGYHIFFTSVFCKEGDDFTFSLHAGNTSEVKFDGYFGSICYGFSDDKGLTWKFRKRPLIYPVEGDWNSHSIETAHVLRLNNKLHLFFSGESEMLPFRWQIGLSTLEIQGNSIRKTLMDESNRFPRAGKPFIARDTSRTHFKNNIQEPAVVVKDGRIELYWIGLGWALPAESGVAKDQGIRGVYLGRSIYDLDLNLLDQTQEPLMEGVNIIEIKYWDGLYYMFGTTLVIGSDFHSDEEIEMLTSKDGLHWENRKTLLSKGPPGGFDDWGIFAATVARDGEELVMFYTAIQVEDKNAPDPNLLKPAERVGIRVLGDKKSVYSGIGRAVAVFK